MKLLYSDKKTGLTASMELDQEKALLFVNRKIGSDVDGTAIGLSGYKLKITGGSDSSGFALDPSIAGQGKVRTMRDRKRKGKSMRIKVMVRGNTITAETKQVSVEIVEYGSKPVEELFPKKAKAEEAKAPEPEKK